MVGETKPPITEKNLPKPISPYGASKLFYESYGCAYSHSFNISAIALRFSNVYGPGSNFKNSVISKFIKDYTNFILQLILHSPEFPIEDLQEKLNIDKYFRLKK